MNHIRFPTRTIRRFLSVEGAAFVIAALIHAEVLNAGYGHRRAATAESVIACVLLAGLALTWVLPLRTRVIGLAAQGFALIGTMVGLAMVAIGVGSRTGPDVIYHVGMIAVLATGLVVTVRSKPGFATTRGIP